MEGSGPLLDVLVFGGSIAKLASGSLRMRVYAGVDVLTGCPNLSQADGAGWAVSCGASGAGTRRAERASHTITAYAATCHLDMGAGRKPNGTPASLAHVDLGTALQPRVT